MIKFRKVKLNIQDRFAAIRDFAPRPSPLQSSPPPQASPLFRAQLTSMEKGSTCRKNPRISTVR